MATKIKLDQGIYLTPLNSESLLEIQDNLEARCFMCREILTNENNFFNLQYQEEVHVLDSLEIVHPLQGLELFAKMVYYKTHYKFDTEHKVIVDASGPYIENKIINATQIRPFNLKELYDLMKNVLQLRGVTDEIPEYVEGKMFSFIPRKV